MTQVIQFNLKWSTSCQGNRCKRNCNEFCREHWVMNLRDLSLLFSLFVIWKVTWRPFVISSGSIEETRMNTRLSLTQKLHLNCTFPLEKQTQSLFLFTRSTDIYPWVPFVIVLLEATVKRITEAFWDNFDVIWRFESKISVRFVIGLRYQKGMLALGKEEKSVSLSSKFLSVDKGQFFFRVKSFYTPRDMWILVCCLWTFLTGSKTRNRNMEQVFLLK